MCACAACCGSRSSSACSTTHTAVGDTGACGVVAQRHVVARDVARRAAIMLKNGRDTLPLPAAPKVCVLIGPLADASAG